MLHPTRPWTPRIARQACLLCRETSTTQRRVRVRHVEAGVARRVIHIVIFYMVHEKEPSSLRDLDSLPRPQGLRTRRRRHQGDAAPAAVMKTSHTPVAPPPSSTAERRRPSALQSSPSACRHSTAWARGRGPAGARLVVRVAEPGVPLEVVLRGGEVGEWEGSACRPDGWAWKVDCRKQLGTRIFKAQ